MTEAVKNNKYLIKTPEGWSNFEGVRKSKTSATISVFTESRKHIECTLDHQLYTKYGWMPAETIEVDDVIKTVDGFERVHHVHVDKFGGQDVFDALHVSKSNQYFTGGILSHNCAFLGSSGTLIEGSKLKALVFREPEAESNKIKMFEKPIEGHTYVMAADVSRGKGLDYSTFSVIDITKMPYRQVCTYRDNMVTPVDYAEIIFRISKNYNDAAVLVEINDIGGQVSDTLHFDFEHENILYTESAGRSGKRISGGFGKNVDRGIRTTKTVKSIGCNILKLLVEQDQLVINDFDTINELSTFSRRGVSYEAESGAHDDMVMTLVLFAWLSDQSYFKDLTDINTMMKLRAKSEEQMMDDLIPFGFNADDMYADENATIIDMPHGDSWL